MITSRGEIEELLSTSDNFEKYSKYVWGTGNTAALYLEGIHRSCLKYEIKGYADNNPDKWGKEFDGKPIYNLDDLKKLSDVLVLIASPNPKVINTVTEQLKLNGIRWMHIDECIMKLYKNDVLQCYDLLDDDFSKRTFAGLIECRIKGIYPDASIIDRGQYFSFEYFADYNPGEVYVDCGAYVGDTIEKYIWKMDGAFKKVIAFEPDAKNFKALNTRIRRLKNEWNLAEDAFELYPYGLSDRGSVKYVSRYESNNGFGTKIMENEDDIAEKCEVVSIDEFVGEKIDFIKADIESYEYKLLNGAARSIEKYAPKLAICNYHNVMDFFQIPLLIRRINPKYKIAIRHYTCVLSETIVYAYINE